MLRGRLGTEFSRLHRGNPTGTGSKDAEHCEGGDGQVADTPRPNPIGRVPLGAGAPLIACATHIRP